MSTPPVQDQINALDARVSVLEGHHEQVVQAATGASGQPTISHLEPPTAPLDTAATVQVRGTNFTTDSKVLVAGVLLPTVFVSSTALKATVTAAGAVDATVPLTVQTGGINTKTLPLTIVAAPAPPVLSSLNPSTAELGSPSFTLHAIGTGFTDQAVIVWNGTEEPTTYVSPTELTTQVNMATATTAGPLPVLVRVGAVETSSVDFTLTEAVLGTLSAKRRS